MKHLAKLSAVLAFCMTMIPATHAQMSGMKDMDMKGMASDKKAQDQVHKGTGTVTKVDSAKGAVTIAHSPIQSLNWPSMTMSFAIKDKGLLDKVQTGAKVEFSFVQSGKDYVITDIRR